MTNPRGTRNGRVDKIDRRRFLQATAAAGAVTLARTARARAASGKRPPNILYIITDQQNARMMSCAGNRYVKTPAMDSLAATGARFERAYASNPVCLPARFSMMTGRMPSDLLIRENAGIPDRKPVPEAMLQQAMGWLFRRAGYEVLYGGKTHWPRGMKVASIGFDPLTPNQRDGLADACAEFLKKKHDKPFLLVASFINPHDICYMAIDAYTRAVKKERMFPKSSVERRRLAEALKMPEGVSREAFFKEHCPPLPPNVGIPPLEPECITKLLKMRRFREHARRNWPDDEWRRHRWAYCRLTEMVDAQIGRVLDALREAGLEENTLVVFAGDHGDMDGAHRIEHKTVLYEEASRVPLIVSHKGVTRPGLVDETHLVSVGLDLLPTLCDYAGIDVPAGLRGRSVRALAQGRAPKTWRDDLVVESQIGRMLRTARHKYNVYEDGAHREQLIDLAKDPGEMVNLAEDPKYAQVLGDHRKRLRRWVDETDDEIGKAYVLPGA